ncbi:MAG TPA: EamA family transporter [Candidatus Saccharimonadales bacterium]|nr:EamA family transporter [Candidatus Saccharimonadales bacterium]
MAKWLEVPAYVLLCMIWGTTWVVIQIGLRGIPPLTGVALRFGIASLVLLSLALLMGVRLGRSARERGLWLINALFSFSISYGIVYWCEQWVPSGLAAVLFATYPLFVTLLAHFALPLERITGAELAGILTGFGGVGLIFSQDFSALGGRQVAIASVVMLVSPFVSAVSSVSVKRWGEGIHPLSLTSVPMAMTAGLVGALALATEGARDVRWDASSVGALLYLAIMGSAVTFTLYYWLLSRFTAKRMSLIAYVIPVIAVGIGLARGEPITWQILAGAALVLGGVGLAVHAGRRAAA